MRFPARFWISGNYLVEYLVEVRVSPGRKPAPHWARRATRRLEALPRAILRSMPPSTSPGEFAEVMRPRRASPSLALRRCTIFCSCIVRQIRHETRDHDLPSVTRSGRPA